MAVIFSIPRQAEQLFIEADGSAVGQRRHQSQRKDTPNRATEGSGMSGMSLKTLLLLVSFTSITYSFTLIDTFSQVKVKPNYHQICTYLLLP